MSTANQKNNKPAKTQEATTCIKSSMPLDISSQVVRGILLGGAIGVLIALATERSLFISCGFGMLGGFLAGLTRAWQQKKKSSK